MAVELATAYLTLTVSARGIVEDLSDALSPFEDAAGIIGERAGAALGSGLSSSVKSALADALADPQPIDSARLVDSQGISTAIDAGVSGADPAPVPIEGNTTSIESALADVFDAPRDIPVDGDTSELSTSIDDAVQVDQSVPLDGDASALVASIDDATSPEQTIPVDADVSAAQGAIDDLVTAPVDLVVTADTEEAQDSIDQLAEAAADSSDSVEALSQSTEALSATTGLAKGEVSELGGFIANIGGKSAAAVSGLAAFSAFVGQATSLAADAQVSNKAFADTFGELADRARSIDVGGLTISLEDLGKQSGTTGTALESSAVRVGLLGNAAGAAKPQIAGTASDLLGIAGALAVTNPRMGDTAQVADQLTKAFSTGRTRGLLPFGISISQNAILQEALRENVGKTADELTSYDKVVAGVTLTQQQFGDSLGTKFASGAENAQIQLRAVRVAIEETLAAVGGPLLEPLVSSLQSALPVAQQLGIALGALAQAVLPLVADLGPALTPVAAILADLAAGINVLSDASRALGDSGPKLAVFGVGLAAIALNAGIATEAMVAFDVAMATALGPISIAVGAVALLGLAFGHFHADADRVKVDAAGIADALLASSAATDVLAGKATKLGQDLDTQFKKLLDVGKAGQTAADGATSLGLGYSDLTKILLENDVAFADFVLNTSKTKGLTEEQSLAQSNLVGALQQTRVQLRANATASLQAAVQAGSLTQKQIDQAAATLGVSESGAGLVAIYEKLKPSINAYAETQKRANLTTAVTSGALRDLIAGFNPATGAVSDYTAQLVDMGVAQADADALAKDQTTSLQAQADKTILASSAVTQLSLAFVQGKIGAGELEGGVFALGTSLGAAQGNVSDLQKSIDSFASAAVGALPNVGGAVGDFSSGVQKAFQDVAAAADKSPADVAAAQDRLRAALNPQAFIDDLGREASAIASFQRNLATLISEGLGQLAGVIAAKGPELGAQLAESFANDRTKAVAADGAVQLVNAATANFETFASGGEAAAAMGAGGTALATAASQGYATAFQLANPTRAQLDAARLIVKAAEPGITGTAEGLARASVVAFEAQFGRLPTVTEVQTGAAQAALESAKGPLGNAAQGMGADTTDKYAGALDVPGKTESAIAASAEVWNGAVTATTASSARAGGRVVGFQFDKGVADGINIGTDRIAEAASSAASAAETAMKRKLGIQSPSKVGIAIGENVVDAIAIGFSHTGRLVAASQALAEAATVNVAPSFGSLSTIDDALKRLAQLEAAERQQKAQSAALTAAQQALQSFVSSAVSQLPSAGNAISAFSSKVQAAIADVTKAQAVASKARQKLEADESKLKGALILAQQKLAADVANGASQRQIFRDQDAVNKASHALTVQTLLDTKSLQDSAQSLAGTQAALAAASSPADFIRQIQGQTKNAAQFQSDLQKLVAEKFPLLAAELAKAGPETARKLADALAASPAQAKLAEAAIKQSQQFSTQFQNNLNHAFSTTVGDQVHSVGTQVGDSLLKGATDAVTAAGDVLWTSLSKPFEGKGLKIPEGVTGAIADTTHAITVAAGDNLAASEPIIGPFHFEVPITLPNGQIVTGRATLPAGPLNTRKAADHVLAQGRAR